MIGVMPIVYPDVKESSEHMVLDGLSCTNDLRMVSENREAKQSVAMVACSKVISLCSVATHPPHNLRDSRIRITEFDPAMLMGTVVVLADGSMTPDS